MTPDLRKPLKRVKAPRPLRSSSAMYRDHRCECGHARWEHAPKDGCEASIDRDPSWRCKCDKNKAAVKVRRSSEPKRTKRPRKVRKTTAGQKARTADKLFSLIVRARGKCEWHAIDGMCRGSFQCAHGIGRAYRSVRWDENNAFKLCAGAHVWTTHHPLEWAEFMERQMGRAALDALRVKALKPWDHDIDAVLVRLAARAVALGIKPEGK